MRPCYFNVGVCACHAGPGCQADPAPTSSDRSRARAKADDPTGTALPEFLNARLAEAEQRARRAYGTTWAASAGDALGLAWILDGDDEPLFETRAETAAFIKAHDPRTAIVDVEVKRGIVAAHPITTRIVAYGGNHLHRYGCETCHDWDGSTEGRGYCQTLRLLASGYRGHLGYLPDWAPDAGQSCDAESGVSAGSA